MLKTRRIVISGAGSGIGEAIARLFHARGARVALIDLNGPAVERLAADLPGALALPCDVSDAEGVGAAIDRCVGTMAGLDGVVNVAGVDLIRDFTATTQDDWRRVMDVNLGGPVNICRAALPALGAAEGATIVNIASAAGLRPLAQRTAYCTSKAALIMFTKALALEVARNGPRVNVICPGIIDTPMLRVSYEHAADPAAAYREIVARPAMGRAGDPADIAEAALYLTGPGSSFVTGTVLTVDGGRAFH